MLAKRIIPCLDVNKGRVVKGVQFLSLKDAGDPVAVAQRYDAEGADELIFLDITASAEERHIILNVVERTAEQVFMPLTVGGGIQTLEDIRALLKAGADKVSINTGAVKDPDFVKRAADYFGSQCIVVAIDAKRVGSREFGVRSKNACSKLPTPNSELMTQWEVYTHGGRKNTGQDAIGWARKVVALGAGEILLTSMDQDGTKEGYDLALTRRVSDSVGVPVIASGGAGKLEHLFEVLTEGGADAVLAASIFHYGEVSIPQAKKFLDEKGVTVRI